MELFREDGCLSDEGLHALTAGQLDELGRLEAAEHLSYCDKCTDRYTALLTADALADPPRDVRRTVMSTIWVRLMQSTYGRAAVAGVAAVLALTMWRTGALTFVTDHGSDLQALLPTVQVTLPEKQPPKILPEKLGRPVTSRPGENIYTRVSSVLESLPDVVVCVVLIVCGVWLVKGPHPAKKPDASKDVPEDADFCEYHADEPDNAALLSSPVVNENEVTDDGTEHDE